ncbi:unnamed protein product [Meloidogyne enterolobii]|uniref:Uncharacterized protein n=1 Tax=Meloidogyne enterolobii TaxID=390850 RepID=A0ACB0YEI7_MELEN
MSFQPLHTNLNKIGRSTSTSINFFPPRPSPFQSHTKKVVSLLYHFCAIFYIITHTHTQLFFTLISRFWIFFVCAFYLYFFIKTSLL